jgi:hypothetical protein
MFLKISLDKIAGVLLSDSVAQISEQDYAILKSHNLYDIKNYASSEQISENEQAILDLFNRYYLNTDGGNDAT